MTTALWFVIMLADGTARISDSTFPKPGDGIGVVYRGETIRSCLMYLDRNDIQESVEGPTFKDNLVNLLRERGFEERQIEQVILSHRIA